MKIQLALDRMSIQDAIKMTKKVENYIDWVEVGTSLIKEFGMNSIYLLKEAFPNKTIVADMKTIDNAKYEFQLCFSAGADVATVMGVAPLETIETCESEAAKHNKRVMIDLLNTEKEKVLQLAQYNSILCAHISKDQQEISGLRKKNLEHMFTDVPSLSEMAVAGGISINSMNMLKSIAPSIVIIGSAITKADDPEKSAKELKKFISSIEEI
ncbi:3-hexulose-6-phosphate synthase [Bacillus sp. AL-1R]